MTMGHAPPVFIIDTCIGGLSVVKSLWRAGHAADAQFMADYAVNPLGIKSDDEIADVVRRWLALAERQSDTAVIACNTLSVHYHQLPASAKPSRLKKIVSMVDCFERMVRHETERLAGKKILILGTAFTAGQTVYPDLLRDAVADAQVKSVGATALERSIARFQPRDAGASSVFDAALRQAIETTDVAVLACTCFPLVRAELEWLFPRVTFLDPGAYAPNLLKGDDRNGSRKLHIEVTGNVVEHARVSEFAASWLRGDGTVY